MSKIILCVFLAVGLSGHPRAPLLRRDTLTGIWNVEISSDVASAGTPAAAPPKVEGVIALIRDSVNDFEWMALEGASNFGVYSVDFRGLGFEAPPAVGFPLAAARMVNDSTALVVLNPTQDHQSLRLTGTLRGDSISGRWSESSYGAGLSGTFVMRRQRE
jgi:hypothetical protein